MNESVSKAITFLRFPLIFMVVVLHALFTTLDVNTFFIYNFISTLMSNILARVAVPMFFAISGYLFFYKVVKFSLSVYGDKLRKRINSLLIPYVLWIAIFILAYFVIIKVNLISISGGKTVYDYAMIDYLLAFFNENVSENGAMVVFTGDGAPIAFHMWFIRDLMIACVLTPIIYALCRNVVVGGLVSVVLLVLWIMNMGLDASGHYYLSVITFFSVGAYLQLQNIQLQNLSNAWWLILVYIIGIVVECTLFHGIQPICMIWHNVNILIGIVVFFVVALKISSKVSMPVTLTESTFFVYGTHAMVILLLTKLAQRFVPQSDLLMTITYVLAPIVCTAMCVGVYVLAKLIMPRVTKVLTGGR